MVKGWWMGIIWARYIVIKEYKLLKKSGEGKRSVVNYTSKLINASQRRGTLFHREHICTGGIWILRWDARVVKGVTQLLALIAISITLETEWMGFVTFALTSEPQQNRFALGASLTHSHNHYIYILIHSCSLFSW